MSLNIRTYHELTEADRSGLADQIGAQRRRVADRLASVRRVVAVLSGKGGVGKSFVTAGLARALARSGRTTGVLDADFNGPTAPQLLRIPVASCTLHDGVIEPLVSAEGVRCFSMAFLLEDGRPLAFRGPETEAHVWRETLEAAALRRALRAANDGKATLLGVVENMVGGPFTGSAADELAAEFGIPVLARVPFHPSDDVWEDVVSKLQ